MAKSSPVDVGFSEEFEPYQLESPQFPSKIGGKPAWLSYKNLPSIEQLQCGNCKLPMVLLCQVYAPYEECEQNFHRTIFVFICKQSICCSPNTNVNVKVFRNNIPRQNEFYSFDPPPESRVEFDTEKWVKLCNLCGCLADKNCSKCQSTVYCSREHQTYDWKERHKVNCGNVKVDPEVSKYLYPESLICIEAEEIVETKVDEKKELEKYKKLLQSGQAGTLPEVSEAEIDEHAEVEDKVFEKFRERIAGQPDQILRYDRGGQPLWIAPKPTPNSIPKCQYCNGQRQFEFQVMPQLLSVLSEFNVDFGVLAVYTCKKSCFNKDVYKEEYVFKQDIVENNKDK